MRTLISIGKTIRMWAVKACPNGEPRIVMWLAGMRAYTRMSAVSSAKIAAAAAAKVGCTVVEQRIKRFLVCVQAAALVQHIAVMLKAVRGQ